MKSSNISFAQVYLRSNSGGEVVWNLQFGPLKLVAVQAKEL